LYIRLKTATHYKCNNNNNNNNNNKSKESKVFRYRPGVAQRVGRGIALLFLDRGTRRG
jgi:hypothetical protein